MLDIKAKNAQKHTPSNIAAWRHAQLRRLVASRWRGTARAQHAGGRKKLVFFNPNTLQLDIAIRGMLLLTSSRCFLAASIVALLRRPFACAARSRVRIKSLRRQLQRLLRPFAYAKFFVYLPLDAPNEAGEPVCLVGRSICCLRAKISACYVRRDALNGTKEETRRDSLSN